MYNEWLERIAQVPKDCPTLTEAQWLEACQHFNGCAWCGEPDIDARGFFIEFKYGGRYCNWNVIPVCAKCATKVRIQPNMFITEWYKAAGTPHLNAIVEYLGGKLDESIKSGTSN